MSDETKTIIFWKSDTSPGTGNKPFFFVDSKGNNLSSNLTFNQACLVADTMKELGISVFDRTLNS